MKILDYVSIIKKLPIPTESQTYQFAEFVSDAHSWYKHLPIYPSQPFIFYLDPNAGRSLVHTKGGDVAFVDITDESPRFHYTWQTTQTYRNRFGYWKYYAPYGSSFLFAGEGGVVDTKDALLRILTPQAGWQEVPEDLLWAGEALITALVHPDLNISLFWIDKLENDDIQGTTKLLEKEPFCLPPALARNICELYAHTESEAYKQQWRDYEITKDYNAWEKTAACQKEKDIQNAIYDAADECSKEVKEKLAAVWQKESERQIASMVKAMNRVIKSIWG